MATPSSASWTLALIKPDAFAYAHDILKRVYDNGFVLIAQKQVQMSRDLAQRFYEQHLNKAFFPHLLSFITRCASAWLYSLALVGIARV